MKCQICKQVADNLTEDDSFNVSPERAFRGALMRANEQLHQSDVDDSMSGTTAICCLLRGRHVFIANVGDSRAIVAERDSEGLHAHPLSRDQTPFRSGSDTQLAVGHTIASKYKHDHTQKVRNLWTCWIPCQILGGAITLCSSRKAMQCCSKPDLLHLTLTTEKCLLQKGFWYRAADMQAR